VKNQINNHHFKFFLLKEVVDDIWVGREMDSRLEYRINGVGH